MILAGRGVSANSVAKVDGQDVTIQEVDEVAHNMMQRQHIPEQFKSYILPQAVDAVVMQKVYLREAKRLGLEATDEDLRYEMQHGGLAAGALSEWEVHRRRPVPRSWLRPSST